MKHEKPEYELPIEGVAWTRGAGHPAGVYLLNGRCYFVALGSPAEDVLVERGALHMANVSFERESTDPHGSSRRVRLLEPNEAARWFRRQASPDRRGGHDDAPFEDAGRPLRPGHSKRA